MWETDCMRCYLASPSSFLKLHWPVNSMLHTENDDVSYACHCMICHYIVQLDCQYQVTHPGSTLACPQSNATGDCLAQLGPSWWALVSACLVNLSTSLKVISNMASLLFCSGELLNETTAVCSVTSIRADLLSHIRVTLVWLQPNNWRLLTAAEPISNV